jgi:hypothetical protein
VLSKLHKIIKQQDEENEYLEEKQQNFMTILKPVQALSSI